MGVIYCPNCSEVCYPVYECRCPIKRTLETKKESEENSLTDLVILVDFFKTTGKWYSGCEVNVKQARLWQGHNFLQAIVDNQRILRDGWQGEFHVVTSDLPKFDTDPNYREFSKAFFGAEKFVGITRKGDESE